MEVSEGGIKLTEPHLIDSILDELGFFKQPLAAHKVKDLPVLLTNVSHADPDVTPFKEYWSSEFRMLYTNEHVFKRIPRIRTLNR